MINKLVERVHTSLLIICCMPCRTLGTYWSLHKEGAGRCGNWIANVNCIHNYIENFITMLPLLKQCLVLKHQSYLYEL
ncbi:hypothetical protein HanPI659440_Chr03g0104871 [Helianthus annuus]|nr:hypothetical protein HanPI659440_Chr03g0104871 [Helianthus annuus]